MSDAATSPVVLAAGTAQTGLGEAVTFWVLAATAVVGALGVVLSPRAVYSAVFLAMTMIVLAVFYVMQGALFLGVVQIVVYTGAVMMLFLFVLMLIGVDSSDSLVETIRGQRLLAAGLGAGFAVLLIAALGHAALGPFHGMEERAAAAQTDGSVRALAELIFVDHLWAFELTGALLITATLGAMVLAHRQRLSPKLGQRELSIRRFADGARATPLPPPGVFARHNAVDVPALEPDGSPSKQSVNALLTPRDPAADSGSGARQVGSAAGGER
ncbi:MAG: NADH-quinone oxidoreductase subunit J [Gordonia sp. (in: high G+C Gram-positive bacteria)]|uniref:NADH-quinone oxidoreductase subunit J n=1 Tax=Gordonia sp. (in: high G+C Gram-positive bacteria) TaxID=84139 RepID=UPI0039E2BEB3